MASYNLGDAVNLSTVVTDGSGTLSDTTMALTVTAPDGTTSTPSVTHGTTGMYSALVEADDLEQTGTWFYRWVGTGTVEVTDAGQFTVLDPVAPAYATLAEFTSWLQASNGSTDELVGALNAASRQIDRETGRRFWLDATATARVINPAGRLVADDGGVVLLTWDIGTVQDLVVEIGSVGGGYTATTDFETIPDAAIARQQPITGLLRTFTPWVISQRSRIRITAHWGWPTIPSAINEACLIQAARLYSRKESVNAFAGFSDVGVVRLSTVDPDYARLIAPFKLPGF